MPDPGQFPPEITFQHVSFRYEEDGEDVLSDISLHIRAGEKIAVVGNNGAGKNGGQGGSGAFLEGSHTGGAFGKNKFFGGQGKNLSGDGI